MIKKLAKICGYELIRRKKSPTLESHLANLVRQFRIDLVIDVGANTGQFGLLLREIGYKEYIYSFEPVKSVYQKLIANSHQDEKWKTFNLGISDHSGMAEINVFESSDFSSLLNINELAKSTFKKIGVGGKELINLETLDEALANENLHGRRILLKMDTQGHDLSVFKGSEKTRANVVVMLSEISFQQIYDGMPSYLESLETYGSTGFVVTGLYPVSRKPDGSIIEMDCVMINQRSL